MAYKYCNHIKENGTYCRSAALRGRDYCYFHARLRARRLAMAKARAQKETWNFQVPALEDMQSVQSALMQVMDAIAAGLVDPRRAGLLLYGLQQASTNLRSVTSWIAPSRFQIGEDDEYRAQSYSGLETEFGLPKRIDIATPPEVAFPAPEEPEAPAEPERVASAKKPVVASAAQASKQARSMATAKPAKWMVAASTAKRPPASVKGGSSPGLRAAQAADA